MFFQQISDGQEISHAVVMSKQASKNVYKEDFRKDIQGKSVANPAIAYPEHDRLKKIKDATDKVRLYTYLVILY